MQGEAANAPVLQASDANRHEGHEGVERRRRIKDQSPPPLDTVHAEQEILISPKVDAALERARGFFALSLAWPVALLCRDFCVEGCRARKRQLVHEGAEQVLRIQQACRTELADRYFRFWAFFAEEEFYLLSLPVLHWNIDSRFARQIFFVVSGGLVWGNLLKDVFQLPRPKHFEPKVWMPSTVQEVDTTACRDFGFPSTHAMNSVSNSLFTVLYRLRHSPTAPRATGVGAMLLLAGAWVFSIAFGRLYLGVHSPLDVKAGLLQGLFIALVAQWPLALCEHVDRWLLTAPHANSCLLLLLAVVLVLHPRPRPATPTFLQNCELCGMIFGTAAGFRMEADRLAGRGPLGLGVGSEATAALRAGSNALALPLLALRTAVGCVLVLLTRVALKALFVRAFRTVGLDPRPPKLAPRKEAGDTAQRDIKGWDLWAAAVTKVAVYAALTWAVVCGCPAFFEVVLGLPCE